MYMGSNCVRENRLEDAEAVKDVLGYPRKSE
jgi:hypothetical protein